MPKAKKTNNKAVAKNVELADADFQRLAQAGTKEAAAKLEAYLEKCQDEDKRFAAELALEECELFYYSPNNDTEEREYLLAKLVLNHERHIFDLEMKKERYTAKVDKFRLEQAVHAKVMAARKDKKEAWKYNYIDEVMGWEMDQLEELENQIEYEQAWVAAARKMIKTPRYKNIPARHLDRIHYDFEDDDFEDGGIEDDGTDGDDDCGCGCEADFCDCGEKPDIRPAEMLEPPF